MMRPTFSGTSCTVRPSVAMRMRPMAPAPRLPFHSQRGSDAHDARRRRAVAVCGGCVRCRDARCDTRLLLLLAN